MLFPAKAREVATLGNLSQFPDYLNEASRAQLYAPTGPVERRTAYVGVLVGDGRPPADLWWKADWANYAALKASSVEVLHAPPAVSAARESFAEWAERLPLARPINPYGMTTVSGGGGPRNRKSLDAVARFFHGSGGPNWDNIGEMASLVTRYLSPLSPQQELANLTAIKYIAIKEKWSKDLIHYWTRLVGKKAMDYKHHVEDGVP